MSFHSLSLSHSDFLLYFSLLLYFKVPDLNAENFALVLKKVRNWWNLGVALLVLWNKLDNIERIHHTVEDRLKALFEYFKQMHPYANWRCVIWGLDECGDTDLAIADEIRNFAEPITGTKYYTLLLIAERVIIIFLMTDPSLTIENIVSVLKLMKSRWYNRMAHILAMPASKKIYIKEQYSSKEDQLWVFVEYIHSFHPSMSWGLLAGVLHSMEEHEALEALRARNYLTFRKGWLNH